MRGLGFGLVMLQVAAPRVCLHGQLASLHKPLTCFTCVLLILPRPHCFVAQLDALVAVVGGLDLRLRDVEEKVNAQQAVQAPAAQQPVPPQQQ